MSENLQTTNKKPLSALNNNLNKPAYVVLKNGLSYKGVLAKTDSQMNIILQEAVEYNSEKPSASLGTVLIRGNNILYIKFGDFLE